MVKWILILVVVAIVAGALGYRGVASGASRLALILAALLVVVVVLVLMLFAWAGGGVI